MALQPVVLHVHVLQHPLGIDRQLLREAPLAASITVIFSPPLSPRWQREHPRNRPVFTGGRPLHGQVVLYLLHPRRKVKTMEALPEDWIRRLLRGGFSLLQVLKVQIELHLHPILKGCLLRYPALEPKVHPLPGRHLLQVLPHLPKKPQKQ